MKNQMKGIALILFGILISSTMDAIGIGIFAVAGFIVGIAGLAIVLWNGDWKDRK